MTKPVQEQPPSTSVFLSGLVKSDVKVTVQGKELTLHRPSVPDALKVHEKLERPKGEEVEQTVRRILEAHAMALNACIDESLDLEVACQVVLSTGGITGDLAEACMDLCGLKATVVKPDRPTS